MRIRNIKPQEFIDEPDQYLALYIITFSSKPYYERFCFDDLGYVATDLWFAPQNDGLLLACHHEETSQLMGFLVGFALKAITPINFTLSHALNTDIERCFYIAEIMTRNEFRKQGVARTLVSEALQILSHRYDKFVLRTNAGHGNKGTRAFWEAVGFTEVPSLRTNTPQRRMNGKVTSDSRLFFTRDIKNKGE